MPDLLTTKQALRKTLGIADAQATGQLDIETNVSTVADTATRGIVRVHNKDDPTNSEYVDFSSQGTNGFRLEPLKTGTGSLRNLVLAGGGVGQINVAADGVLYMTGSAVRFNTNNVRFANPAFTFFYQIVTSAIAANRAVTLPLLATDDTFVFEDHAQDLENKTFKPSATNTGITVPIKPTHTTVADTTSRGMLRVHNVDDSTNDEYLQIGAEGTNGYTIDVGKTGTGSYRNFKVKNGGLDIFVARSDGWSQFNKAIFYDDNMLIYNPAQTFYYSISTGALSANRTISLPTLTEDDEVIFEKHHNIITSPERGLAGLAVPSVSNTAASLMFLGGALSGMTQTAGGTPTHTLDATEGMVSNFVSAATANVNCGLTTAAAANNITTPNFNPVLRVRFKIDSITASRVWIGFTGLPVAVSDTPMASGTAGVLFGYIVSGGTFVVLSNDTSGAANSTTMTAIAPDTNWHTVTVSATGSQVQVVLDDGAGAKTQTITTAANRPAGTDSLGVVCTGQTSTTTAKTFSLKFAAFRADK